MPKGVSKCRANLSVSDTLPAECVLGVTSMNLILCYQRPWTCVILLALVLGLTADLTGCGASQVPPPFAAKRLLSVAIAPQTPAIALGNNLQFSATALFSDGSKTDVTTTAAWVSAQPKVAFINAAGMAISK